MLMRTLQLFCSVVCVCVFSFLYIAWAGRASLAAMDELTIIVLCAALAGIIVGSLGLYWYSGVSDIFQIFLRAVDVDVLEDSILN